MDPISAGAMKHVQQSVFEQAEQQIQKSNQSISDFEKLRQQLDNQDAISNQQANQANAPNQIDQAQQNEQINQIDPSNADLKVQRAGNLQDVAGVPEIKNTGQLEAAINHIRSGQTRLNELIDSAMSGKTYSPQEMLALQAEIGKITNDLELASKVVDQASQGLKQMLNMQM
jgi:hypothetical protein